MQAGTFSVCSRRQNSRPVQAGTFPLFVLLVKGTGVCKLVLSLSVLVVRTPGQCKLVLSLSLFSLSKAQACTSCTVSLFCSSEAQARASCTFSLFCSSEAQARASWYFLFVLVVKSTGQCKLVFSLCSARQRHRCVQAGTFSVCSRCQNYRPVQAGTFCVFVLLVKGTGTCKLILSLSLFCSSKAHAHASRWYFLRLCFPRQNHRPVQVGNFSVFVLLVKTTGACKLVLSLTLFCSSKAQAHESWYDAGSRKRVLSLSLFSASKRPRPTKAGTFSVLVLLAVESPVPVV